MKPIGLRLLAAGVLLILLGAGWLWFGSEAVQLRPTPDEPLAGSAQLSLSYRKKQQAATAPPQLEFGKAKRPLAAQASRAENSPALYYGLCDASAVAALNAEFFVVGDDEDNVLRVYKRGTGGQPVFSRDFSAFLRVDPKAPEVDLEGADRLGDYIYWISSHGRNFKGKEAPGRRRFFATTGFVSNGIISLNPVGQPYFGLLADMLNEPRLARFSLGQAAALPPKSRGALNIEGLSATPQGQLLIGFRNPIPQGKALLLPLLNPPELLEGGRARFGDPVLLDLDGRGIRSITYWFGHYFIVAGSSEAGGKSRFYLWDGAGPPQRLEGIEIGGLNPEAVAFWGEQGLERLYIVSDDGTEHYLGTQCKKLKNSSWKRFRAVCLNFAGDATRIE